MADRKLASNLGIYVYAGAACLLGLIGLVSGDFATNWQRVEPGVPFRTSLAYIAAMLELLAGLAVFWRPSARAGALMLTTLFSIYALLWVPKIAAGPLIWDSWGNLFEELSAVLGGAVSCTALAPSGSALSRRELQFARIYGVCVIAFGVGHVFYFSGLPAWIPKWIPPGQVFWAVATTVCFFLAAGAILTGILSPLAARLLTIMIMGFELLVWVPKLFAAPHDHFSWSGNGICLALAGAAWVVSDSIGAAAQRKSSQPEFAREVGSIA